MTGQIVSSDLPVSTFAQGIRNSEPDLGSKQRGGHSLGYVLIPLSQLCVAGRHAPTSIMHDFLTWTGLSDFGDVGDCTRRAEAADLPASVRNKLFQIQNLYRQFRSSTVAEFRFVFFMYFFGRLQNSCKCVGSLI